MNSKGIIAITDHEICMECLKNKATNTYHISGRGYGSSFDSMYTHLQLCDDCHNDEYDTWFNESSSDIDCKETWYEEYIHEDNITQYIANLPLESQELFYNSFSREYYFDDPQDWIDYELDELSHEKCKTHGFYSPEERKAYKDRFPTCGKVYLKEWKDGSSGCWCHNQAHGNSDGSCDQYNISSECYMCTSYIPKAGSMKIVNEVDKFYTDEMNRLNEMIEYAQNRIKEMEELGVSKYMEKYE